MKKTTIGGIVAVLVLLVLPTALFGLGWITHPLMWLVRNPAIMLGIVVAVVAMVFWFRLKELKTVPAERRTEQAAINARSGRIAWVTALFGVPLTVLAFIVLNWAQEAQLANSYTADEQVPSYEYRAPFVVADQLSNRDLDNVIGDRVGVHAVQPADNPNQYTTLVIRRGLFQGYEAIQVIQPPLVGARSQTSVACHFDPGHKLRLGGFAPTNNLGYHLSFKRPFSFWDESDAYGFCDGEEPVVVVPLKKLGGFWPVITDRPDGVAVYRGRDLTVYGADEVPAELVGPTYPRSIAAQQREASVASGSFSDWVFKRAGFDTAGQQPSDDEDEDSTASADEPNAANAVDFSLVNSEGQGEYVTALTPIGASESVVALGHLSNRQSGSDLNPYVVSRYAEPLPALSTSENRIRSDFNHLPGWASGMRVMEITPAADGNYVASIGQNQVVTYRMLVATDGTVTILDTAGEGAPPPQGEQPGGDGDPSTMSTAELQRLIKEYTDELASRADG